MASSGSYNFTVMESEIINLAAEMAGVKGAGRVLSNEVYANFRLLLNLIVKQWQGKSDFAPGLKVWTRKRAYLFPELNEEQYSLGTSGDNATLSYNSTTISANEAIGQMTLSVTSTTGMTVADNIGIRCNDGSIHWTTISSTGAGPTVVVASALTVAADAGNTVYWYTTKIPFPLEIISLRRKDTSGNETPLSRLTLQQYEEGLLKKNDTGIPTGFIYERGISSGTLTFDYGVTDTSEIYLLTFLRPVEDFDSATDTPDYPQEWYRPLVGQLAMDGATAYGKPVTDEMKLLRDESLALAGNVDPDQETEDVFFKSET